MRTMKRSPVNKNKSAKTFRKQVGHTKGANMHNAPMRGGYRL